MKNLTKRQEEILNLIKTHILELGLGENYYESKIGKQYTLLFNVSIERFI